MQDQNQKTEEPGEINLISKMFFIAAGLIFMFACVMAVVDPSI